METNRVAQFINRAFELLYRAFGPQHWWPAETPFEVMVGAVLTQNTNWSNVEKAIENLRAKGLLNPERLYHTDRQTIAELIRPAGYFNIKAERLKALLDYLYHRWNNNITLMSRHDTATLRKELLQIKGIGPETADSILLYALQKPVFVVDAYTKRVLYRHALLKKNATYSDIQALFHRYLPRNTALYNEYHALFVVLGKKHCRSKPLCSTCPLVEFLPESLHKDISTTGW